MLTTLPRKYQFNIVINSDLIKGRLRTSGVEFTDTDATDERSVPLVLLN